MSSTDDLRIASIKPEEVQQMIEDQETKYNHNLYMVATSWGSAFGIICIILTYITCSCCRSSFFWLRGKWNTKECWKQTQDKCCVSIYNYNCTREEYAKTNTSPVVINKIAARIGRHYY
jgi:hypothetical protein